jgi:hypothetical protein
LAAALPAAGSDWKAYEEAMYRTLAQPEALRTLKLLEAYQRVTNPALKRELGDLLIVATSAKPKSLEPADVVRAVRQAIGGASAAASTAQDRWLALQLEVETALSRPAPPTGDPVGHMTQIVELAHLTTLAMALAQGDAGFATFDAGLDKPPQLESESTGEPTTDLPAPRRAFAPLSLKDRTELARLVEQVAGHARLQQVQRESNFRALAEWAEKAGDILPQQAIQIAQYILATKPPDEQASVVSKLNDVRRWKRLRLAVADLLEASKLSPDQRQQVVAPLLRGGVPPEATTAAALRHALLEDVLSDLEDASPARPATTRPAAAGADSRLDKLAELLTETYRTRARLLSVGSGETTAALAPSQALVLSIAPLASSLGSVAVGDDSRYLGQLAHQTFALDSLAAGHDPRRTAAVQRVFVELSSRRLARFRPTQASDAKKLLEEAVSTELAAPHVLAQVRQQELAALRIWMLYAPST